MYNQTDAILAQYELEIRQITKGRGTYICDTDQGMKLLAQFRGSKGKGQWLQHYLDALNRNGYVAEQIISNRNGEAVTEDEVTGERFLIKDYISGPEMGTARFGEMIEVAAILAEYHIAAERTFFAMHGDESAKGYIELDVATVRTRHAKELHKVRNYIRTRKKKQDFEGLYLQSFSQMYEVAEQSCALLLLDAQDEARRIICHGDCNQHNVVWTQEGWRLIHFENAVCSCPEWDLATYLRKMMEKNNWDEELGEEMVRAYNRIRPLGKRGLMELYALMLFPEKYWKLANQYMNSNKSWISARNTEKLEKVIAQEPKRLKFLQNLFSIAKE